jgi:hypothetical protein
MAPCSRLPGQPCVRHVAPYHPAPDARRPTPLYPPGRGWGRGTTPRRAWCRGRPQTSDTAPARRSTRRVRCACREGGACVRACVRVCVRALCADPRGPLKRTSGSLGLEPRLHWGPSTQPSIPAGAGGAPRALAGVQLRPRCRRATQLNPPRQRQTASRSIPPATPPPSPQKVRDQLLMLIRAGERAHSPTPCARFNEEVTAVGGFKRVCMYSGECMCLLVCVRARARVCRRQASTSRAFRDQPLAPCTPSPSPPHPAGVPRPARRGAGREGLQRRVPLPCARAPPAAWTAAAHGGSDALARLLPWPHLHTCPCANRQAA